jgi:NAD(P)-dependent dehydrogenase (short-subunit alcohol dehydrogenase family)
MRGRTLNKANEGAFAMTQAPTFQTDAYAVENFCNRYQGRVAMVIGGAQGLGRVVAKRLGQEGAKVVIADIQEERGIATANSLAQETGSQYIHVGGDLSTAEASKALVQRTMDQWSRVDTVISCAAYQARQPFLEFPEEQMQKSVAVNVWALVRPLQAVLPVMMEQRYGRVVTTGGGAFETGGPWHSFLAGVGKGSVVGLTTTLAGEFGSFGITFNCVSPMAYEFRNDGTPDSNAGGREPELNVKPEQVEKYLGAQRGGGLRMALGRAAHPTELAAAFAFLGSPEASYITGQLLKVNGGSAML